MSRLALYGGTPVRTEPYPRHTTYIGRAEESRVLDVLRSGHLSGFSATAGKRFLGGPEVRTLEADFAEKFGVKYAVATNSASTALHCAIAALGIGPGDEVITSPFTMCATAAAIVSNGATPIFADIEANTYGLDPAHVWAKITKQTKAILTVNLFGHPSWLDTLAHVAQSSGIKMVEDNAQSPGSRYGNRLSGTVGCIGVQSLNYHKCIQAGEGGIALTDNLYMAVQMRHVRNHGEALGANFLGGNYRMTELTAAVAICQLAKMDDLIRIRQDLAGLLTQSLAPFDFLEPPRTSDGCTHVYYLYPIQYGLDISRNLFVRAMLAEGISIAGGYTTPTHLLPFYRKRYGYGEGLCPVAEWLRRERILTTDICKWPNTETEVAQFAEAVKKIADNAGELRSRG